MLIAGCGDDASAPAGTDKESKMFLEILMGKKPKQTYVIASPMTGTLKQNGKPLAHVKIIRRLRWNGNENGIEQEFATDEKGGFLLPVHEEQLVLGKLTQFVCSTQLDVEVDGERFDLWYGNKFEAQLYAETGGRKLEGMVCDLNNEEVVAEYGVSRIMTVCRWIDMPGS
jgi:hypothetical protein